MGFQYGQKSWCARCDFWWKIVCCLVCLWCCVETGQDLCCWWRGCVQFDSRLQPQHIVAPTSDYTAAPSTMATAWALSWSVMSWTVMCQAMFCCWDCYHVSCLLFVLLSEEVGQTRQLQLVLAYFKHHDGSVLKYMYPDWCLLGEHPKTKCTSTSNDGSASANGLQCGFCRDAVSSTCSFLHALGLVTCSMLHLRDRFAQYCSSGSVMDTCAASCDWSWVQLRNGLLCKLDSMMFMILIVIFVSKNSVFLFYITENVVIPSLNLMV